MSRLRFKVGDADYCIDHKARTVLKQPEGSTLTYDEVLALNIANPPPPPPALRDFQGNQRNAIEFLLNQYNATLGRPGRA